jgi:hypothetical protein
MQTFYEKNEPYISFIWSLSLMLGYAYSFFQWVAALFLTASEKNFFGFIMLFILQSLWMGITGLFYSAIAFVCLISISAIPYFIWKGIRS